MKLIGILLLMVALSAEARDDARARLILSPDTTELESLTVYGEREDFPERPPILLKYGTAIGLWALTPFFQQPRVRGEPNDEAAYYALRSAHCIDDSPGCIDRHPNRDLYNWTPGVPEDDAVLNSANSVLGVK